MAEKIIDRRAITMYEEDQAKYAVVVDRRRALPEVRDGLKPVQRRVVYGANIDGLTSPSKKDKSASLTGTVMKHYHPHGSGCLDGSTIIYNLNGSYYTIEQLFNMNVDYIDILAVNGEGKIVPARATHFRIGKFTDKEYNIHLSNGHVIKCTDNHSFLTADLNWLRADQIQPLTRLYCKSMKISDVDNKLTIDRQYIRDILDENRTGFIPKPKDGSKLKKDEYLSGTKPIFSKNNILGIPNIEQLVELSKKDEDEFCDPIDFIYKDKDDIYQVFRNMIDNDLSLSLDNYCNFVNYIISNPQTKMFKGIKDDPKKIVFLIELFKIEYPYVEHVEVIDVESKPMYDFTVDGFENMMIPVMSPANIMTKQFINFNIPMISTHNSIYDAIVTLENWFKTKYPLMYGKGNWGNVSGAGAAAERYTECALSNFGYDMLVDELRESNNIVDWVETYKRNNEKEPEFLPAKVPLLLLNGSFGIGVGMTVSVPSYNLVEVLEMTRSLMKDPNQEVVLIPDLCQPCILIDTDWRSICNTGRGSFKARGQIVTETDKKGNYILRIISLPEMVSATAVYDKINEMIEKKQLPMIKDIFNSLSKDERPDIIIHLRPGSDPEYVKQVIYAKTDVQRSVLVNFEAVDVNGIDIKRFSFKEYLLTFIDQRMNVKFRLYCNRLQQVMTRHLQIDAYIKVLESGEIDNIINLIRKQKTTDDTDLIEHIIKKVGINDIQAKFIINTNLSRLSMGHLNNYKAERKDLEAKMKQYTVAVTDDGSIIKAEIDQELLEIEKKYGSPRICKVESAADANAIPKGTFKIVITERNYIRKIPDVDKVGIVKKDNPKFILKVDNAENILLFDNKGKVFNLPISKVPITDRNGVGTDIRILIKNLTSDIISVYYEPIFQKIAKSGVKHYLTVLMKNNTIKNLCIDDFLNVNPSGLVYSKIKDDDEVVGITLTPYNLDVVICSGRKALRITTKEIPEFKRNAIGNKAMNTNEPMNGLSVIYPDATHIVVVTKNGMFNKFNIGLLEPKSRAKAGSSVIKLSGNDEIFNIFSVNETDKIRILTSEGIEEINVSDIKEKSSIAAGTKMMKSKGIIVRADVVR